MATVMLAIKLGSSTTTIYRQGEGFLLSEPTLVAVTTSSHGREVIAVGGEAKRLQGKDGEGSQIGIISPVSEGVIVDSDLATAMLKEFVLKICPKKFIKPNIRALVCVPLGISLTERLAFEKVCYGAGISDCILIPSVICSAIGIGKDISAETANLVVSIGGGCTDIALIGQNMLINGVNIGMGGQNIDKAIEQQVLNNFNIVISDNMAERVKREIGSLYLNDFNEFTITGKDNVTKESKSVTITAMDIYPAIEHYYSKIAESISSLLAICSPEVVSEATNNGISFVGGDSKIVGIEKYYKTKLNIEVASFVDAEDIEIIGASRLLEDLNALKHLLINV